MKSMISFIIIIFLIIYGLNIKKISPLINFFYHTKYYKSEKFNIDVKLKDTLKVCGFGYERWCYLYIHYLNSYEYGELTYIDTKDLALGKILTIHSPLLVMGKNKKITSFLISDSALQTIASKDKIYHDVFIILNIFLYYLLLFFFIVFISLSFTFLQKFLKNSFVKKN